MLLGKSCRATYPRKTSSIKPRRIQIFYLLVLDFFFKSYKKYGAFDSLINEDGDSKIQFWYARDLMMQLGYTEWRNFTGVIEKAKASCENSGIPIKNHFVDLNKMVELGRVKSSEKKMIKESELPKNIEKKYDDKE